MPKYLCLTCGVGLECSVCEAEEQRRAGHELIREDGKTECWQCGELTDDVGDDVPLCDSCHEKWLSCVLPPFELVREIPALYPRR